MFDNQIRLIGKHADIIKLYSKDKQAVDAKYLNLDNGDGKTITTYIFADMLQCYLVAAMVGIVNKRKSPVDNITKTTPANIFAEKVYKARASLERIYQFAVLSESDETNIDQKIKDAFSVNFLPDADQLVESYARGGLEIIDEHFCNCTSMEELGNVLIELLDEYGMVNNDE